jgi:N6-L-threonylcarbamoyladenine synthase
LRGELIGKSRDDAAGEAFDKGASLLGLSYPGGPEISRAGENGNPSAYEFPLPLAKEQTLDYSFSGLKTSLRYLIRDLGDDWKNRLADISASYEYALCRHLVDRVSRALEIHDEIQEVHVIGGVSANTRLKKLLNDVCEKHQKILRTPAKREYCTDNAAMIASAAYWMHTEDPAHAYESFVTSATTSSQELLSVR